MILINNANFTFETMVNNQMLFLGCLFIRESDNVEVKVYEKPTHRGQYTYYTSNVAPKKHKGISDFGIGYLIYFPSCFLDFSKQLEPASPQNHLSSS